MTSDREDLAATRESAEGLVVVMAMAWMRARRAFLALPAGSPNVRIHLDKLSDAEVDLYRVTHKLEAKP